MIKVGHIYKPKNNEDAIFVVTRTEEAVGCCYIIWDDGSANYHNINEEKIELIAEYPTWQEAVNSKEFRENEE